ENAAGKGWGFIVVQLRLRHLPQLRIQIAGLDEMLSAQCNLAFVPAVGLDHNDPISCLAAGVTRLFMHPEQAGGDLVPRQEFHPGRPLASAQSLNLAMADHTIVLMHARPGCDSGHFVSRSSWALGE